MRCGVADELEGKDFIALRRLSDRADNTLAEEGETCDLVPVVSLLPLLRSGKIAPKPQAES
jgi:hypothetical protein